MKTNLLIILFALINLSLFAQVTERDATTGHSTVTVSNEESSIGVTIYYFGGEKSTGTYSNELWKCEAPGVYIEVETNEGPSARRDHLSWVYGNTMFVKGGRIEGGTCLDDLWGLDLSSNTWTQHSSSLGNSAYSQAAVVIGSIVYIYGGSNSDGESLDGFYSINMDSKSFILDVLTSGVEALQGMAIAAYNGAVCVIGGLLHDWDNVAPGYQPSFSANTWRYNPSKNDEKGTWEYVTTTGDPFTELTFMAYTQDPDNNYLYTFGGRTYDYENELELFDNEIFKLDLTTMTWSELPVTLPVSISNATASFAGDKILIFGGQDENENVSESMYIFYPATNTIEEITYIENQNARTNVSIFPNPAESFIQISTFNQTEIKYVDIIDCTGKTVLETEVLPNSTIDISGLNSGIYFIKFEGNNSDTNYKLIKL